MRRGRAFSLIELLVVIAVIAILMSLFLPVLGGIGGLRKQTACQKNLSDIHKAFSGYASMNEGWYPYPVDTGQGDRFIGPWVSARDPWAGLTQVKQLKQSGAKADMFFCPYDVNYGDWDSWPANTWAQPLRPGWDPDNVHVYIGYSLFIYRAWSGPRSGPYQHTMFADGRYTIGNTGGDDDVPIVADMLAAGGDREAAGWYHGGGVPDGVYNSSCNTLFKSGAVVYTETGEFDWSRPALTVGRRNWWCALGRGNQAP